MSDKRGIFSLEEIYDLQVSGETSKILDVFRFVNQAPGETITSVGYDYAYAAGDNFNKLTGSSEEEQKKIQGN